MLLSDEDISDTEEPRSGKCVTCRLCFNDFQMTIDDQYRLLLCCLDALFDHVFYACFGGSSQANPEKLKDRVQTR